MELSDRQRHRIRRGLSILAALLLLAGAWLAWDFYRLSPERLYQRFYKPLQLPPDSPLWPAGDSLAAAYRRADWPALLPVHGGIKPASPTHTLLTAVSLLQVRRVPESVAQLSQLLLRDQLPDTLRQEAEYQLAMAYLRNGDYDFAIDQLGAIREQPSHLHRSDASRRLIRRIKWLKWR